jgi:4,5-DOPA dioxygenase extradiol
VSAERVDPGSQRFPVGFVGHGNPLSVLDTEKTSEWREWADSLPTPSAILVISAHWEGVPLALGSTERHVDLVYDFWGFPEALYRLQYPAPGASDLARAVEGLLAEGPRPIESGRSLDHGVWIPLLRMWPDAQLPVLQLSMPRTFSDADLYSLGRRLATLRGHGVLILASGNLVHDLTGADLTADSEPPQYAREFDAWVAERLSTGDHESLVRWRETAPSARRAHPTAEHFRPILVAAGAAGDDSVCFPVEGFENRTVSRRCVQFG